MLTFIIPVRHPSGVADWDEAMAYMRQTLASLAAQTHPGWTCMIAAEREAALPPLPAGVDVVRTDIPPTPLPDMREDEPGYYRAVRKDKGARMLAALVAAQPEGHVMFVDYDDFVSRRLAALAAAEPEANGWYVDRGLLWSGGPFARLRRSEFHRLCGTSHIVASRLIEIPERVEDADLDYVSRMYGSHAFIAEELARQGTPLTPLPFPGAIYRVGHTASVSGSTSVRERLVNLASLRSPRRLLTTRVIGPGTRAEFFGAS